LLTVTLFVENAPPGDGLSTWERQIIRAGDGLATNQAN
jgi:hypothetical protein